MQVLEQMKDFGIDVAKDVPLIGSAIGIIEKIITKVYTKFKEESYEKRVKDINAIFRNHTNDDSEVSKIIALFAIKLTKFREKDIV